jgi:hypothetical protein
MNIFKRTVRNGQESTKRPALRTLPVDILFDRSEKWFYGVFRKVTQRNTVYRKVVTQTVTPYLKGTHERLNTGGRRQQKGL